VVQNVVDKSRIVKSDISRLWPALLSDRFRAHKRMLYDTSPMFSEAVNGFAKAEGLVLESHARFINATVNDYDAQEPELAQLRQRICYSR
jgi:hypothetical protein